MHKIFVYGTLRKGMRNYNLYLKHLDSFRQYAYVKGNLYTLQDVDYPALIAGTQNILGEIHEVDDETLKLLDDLEGYIAFDYIDNEYNKVETRLYDEHGNIIMIGPVFFYNDKNIVNQAKLEIKIAECDYVAYMKKGNL